MAGNHYYSTPEEEYSYELEKKNTSSFLDTVYSRLDALPESSYVLDLGCGSGRFVKYAPTGRKWSYYGIDHDVIATEDAKRYIQEGDIVQQGDITILDSGDLEGAGRIKSIVAHRVLHGVPHDLLGHVMELASSILASGDEFYLSVASTDDWKAQELKEQGLYKAGVANDCTAVMFDQSGVQRGDRFMVYFFEMEELRQLAAAAGFGVIEAVPFTEPSGYAHLKNKQNSYWGMFLGKR